MTAQPAKPRVDRPWAADPVRERLADHTIEDVLPRPFDIRLPIAAITP